MKNWVLLFVIVGLAGCATVGREIDTSKLSTFEKGVTTRAQVEAAIGAPNSITAMPDGSTLAGYMFVHSSTRAATFIPFIGPMIGGTDSRSQMISIKYDGAGIYQSAMSSISQSGAGMGLAAGNYQP